MAQSKTKEEIRQENIESGVSKVEEIYNKYKKVIWGVLAGIVAVVGVYILIHQFVYLPKCAEAQQQAYPAEQSFMAGDWQTALNGDGNAMGFADIIDEYGTKSGKDVYLYAGICSLQMGNYEEAVSYLKKYDGKDDILKARAQACLGDAYAGLEEYGKAVSCFKKAAAVKDNVYAAGYLMKEALVYEKLGQNDKALACYETIKDKYPQSYEGFSIDKYIARIKAAAEE